MPKAGDIHPTIAIVHAINHAIIAMGAVRYGGTGIRKSPLRASFARIFSRDGCPTSRSGHTQTSYPSTRYKCVSQKDEGFAGCLRSIVWGRCFRWRVWIKFWFVHFAAEMRRFFRCLQSPNYFARTPSQRSIPITGSAKRNAASCAGVPAALKHSYIGRGVSGVAMLSFFRRHSPRFSPPSYW